MKPIHGDTVSNDGYSSTSCSYRSESGQAHPGTRNNLSRLFHEKYIPLRESKLLEKLVKTRALYEELRSQLLFSSLSNCSNPNLNSGRQHSVTEKDDEAEKSNIVALVDLVDKGVILRPKTLNRSHSFSNRKSQVSHGPREYMQRKFYPREYLTSKSSIISINKPDDEKRLGRQLKTKNIKSDPCTCTLKYSEILKRKSKEVLKRVSRINTKKVNKQSNKKIVHKLKRSKPHFIEGTKLCVAKSIQSVDNETVQASTSNFVQKRYNTTSSAYRYDTNLTINKTSDNSQLESRKYSAEGKNNLNGNSLRQKVNINQNHDTAIVKHRIALEKMQSKRLATEKRELNMNKTPKKIPLMLKKSISRHMIGSIRIKKPKDNVNFYSKEQNCRVFKIMTCLLPKLAKRSVPTTNVASKLTEELTEINQQIPMLLEKENKKLEACHAREHYKAKKEFLDSIQENCATKQNSKSDELRLNKQKIWDLQHKHGVQNYGNDKIGNDNIPTIKCSESRCKIQNGSHELKRCFCPRSTLENNNIQSKQSNSLLPCEPLTYTLRECIPNKYDPKLREQIHDLRKKITKIKVDSVKRNMLQFVLLNSSNDNKFLKKGTSLKYTSKSKYTLPRYRLRKFQYLSNPGEKHMSNLFTKSATVHKGIVKSLDRIATVPKKYQYHNKRVKRPVKKYIRSSKRCIKSINDNRKVGFTYNHLSPLHQLGKAKKHISSLVSYNSEVLIQTFKQGNNYKNLQSRHKRISNRTSKIFTDSKYNLTAINRSITQKNTKSQKNEKKSGWMISPAKNKLLKDSVTKSSSLNNKHHHIMYSKKENNVENKILNNNRNLPQGLDIKKYAEKVKQGKNIDIKITNQEIENVSKSSNVKSNDRNANNNILEQPCSKKLKDTVKSEKNKSKNKVYKLMKKAITRRASVTKRNLKLGKKVEDSPIPKNYASTLKLFTNSENSKLLTSDKIRKVESVHILKRNSIAKVVTTSPNCLNSSIAKKNRMHSKSSSKILSLSTISFKSKKSVSHASQLKVFSSNDQIFNITSKQTLEIKSKFSCVVNFSKHILSKKGSVKTSKSKIFPMVLGQREVRYLENKTTLTYPLQIDRPLEVNDQLTGVPSLLKRCFCTMNIQVGGRRAPKKIPYKLKDYECEPGVCIPYECDPYECQKLIMQRLMRKVSKLSGTDNKLRSSSSLTSHYKPNLKTKRMQSSSSQERKRKVVRAKPQGLTYQSPPRQPQTVVQSRRQATRLGSTFSFDVEFSKNKSKASPGKVKAPKTVSRSAHPKVKEKHLKDKGYGTNKGAHKRNRPSQSAMKKVYHRASTVGPSLKRCFCTLKLQKKGRQQRIKDSHTMGTSTPTKMKAQPKQIVKKTRERGQTAKLKKKKEKKQVLLPYECEPGICIPGECNPYECLELIKRRNLRSRGTESITSNISTSSSMTSSAKKRIRPRYSQSKPMHPKPIQSKETIVRSKPSALSSDRLSTSSAKQAVKLGSSFSFNVEFYKDRNRTTSTPSVAEKRPVKEIHVEKKVKREKKPKIDKKPKPKRKVSNRIGTKKAKRKHFSSQNSKVTSNEFSQAGRGFNSFLKRCFCTAKLQGIKKKNLPKKDYDSASTSTEEVIPMKLEKPAKTQTQRKKRVLEPYECEPGICTPGSCDPYECLKLIKKRMAKEKGTGPERRKTRSVSSGFTSSKTSKAGVAQSMLHASLPRKRVKQPRSKSTSESVIVEGDSSQESNTRQAVRIGSTFSFDIEFYKDRQFPSYRAVQAASEAIRANRRKIRDVSHSQNTKNDTSSQVSRHSQMDGADKRDKALAPILQRCFCTLKLQKKQKPRKMPKSKPKPKPTKPPRPKVRPPKHRGTKTPFSRPVADLHDRSIMTAYKLKTYPYKLDPYECEPGVCIPGECDPYECLERIKRRHMDRGSSTDNVRTKSTVNMTHGRRHRDTKMQHVTMEKRGKVRTVRPKVAEPRVESRTIVSSPSGSKQAVKIGSSFSFNVEFYKDRSRSGSHSTGPKLPPKPRREKVKRPVSRTSQGISVSTGRRKVQHTKAIRDTDSQTMARKMQSTMTGVGPFLKRCFCTLQLQKRARKEPKPKKRKPEAESISVATETMKYKPEIRARHMGTHADKKFKYKGRTLDPNECEPGVCIPGECDPYECLERIKRRGMHSKQSSTGPHKSHSVSSSAGVYGKSKPMRTQMSAPKEKKVKTKRTHDRPSAKVVTYDVTPTEQSHKQAVRIGSSFSFNIEFYKDRTNQVAAVQDVGDHVDTAKQKKKTFKRTRSGTTKRSRSMASSYGGARYRGHGMQSKTDTHSRGSGANPLLKRCFCTLKLQKIGKEQILSNTQLQTGPAYIETTYKHAGTKVKKKPPAKPIPAARERGTKTKRGHELLPYECEPGVCVPGECDPYECLERIKRRNKRHSGTGTETRTKSMSSLTARTKTTKSINTRALKQRRERQKARHTESHYKVQQPPRPSRALENININNRQAVRLGSDFGFNIEFYKDRSSVKDSHRATMPVCSPSVCEEPTCTPSKCKTSSCTTKCSYKNQGSAYDSSGRHHKKLQSRGARTESRGSSVKRLKRCFCTLTLQRAEIKTVMNSLRTATHSVKTQDKGTITKKKYFPNLLPYECEPGVCIPGECDPYECLERIKRRRGPYGPCDCLDKRKARIRRVSRTTETSVRRSREVPARQLLSGNRKMQYTEPPPVDNIVEEPRFKMFSNPYTKNSVKISSNFSFNIEFTRDISFPSSTVTTDQETDYSQVETPKIKKVRETQKPLALKNEMTATDILKRCFCTKQLSQLESRDDVPYASQLFRKCFCSKTHAPIEHVPIEDDTLEQPFYRRCFCAKKLLQKKSRSHKEILDGPKVVPSTAKSVKKEESIASYRNPNCQCRTQCTCKGRIKCLCKAPTKCVCESKENARRRRHRCLCPSVKGLTVARVEINHVKPKLDTNYTAQFDTKPTEYTHANANQLLGSGSMVKCIHSQNLLQSNSYNSKCNTVIPATSSIKLPKCFGRHRLFEAKTKNSNTTSNIRSTNPNKKTPVRLKSLSAELHKPTGLGTEKQLASKPKLLRRKSLKTTHTNRLFRSLLKLYSLNLIKTKSDHRISEVSTRPKLIDIPKYPSSPLDFRSSRLHSKVISKNVKDYGSTVGGSEYVNNKNKFSLFRPKEYWVQYQIRHSTIQKRCHKRNKCVSTINQNQTDSKSAPANLETIMCYSPDKFHKTNSKTLLYRNSSKVTTNQVRLISLSNQKPLKNKARCVDKQHSNKENVVYTTERLILEKKQVSIENFKSREENAPPNFRKTICDCLRIFKQKNKPCANNKSVYTQYLDKDIKINNNSTSTTCKTGMKWERKSDGLHNNKILKDQQVQSSRGKNLCCSKIKNVASNVDKKVKVTSCNTEKSRGPTVSFHDKIIFCGNQNTQCPSANLQSKATYCKSKNSQCPTAEGNNKITYCVSKNSQCPTTGVPLQLTCKSQNIQCGKDSIPKNITNSRSQNSQCYTARVHDKNTFKPQNTRSVTTDCLDEVLKRSTQKSQCVSAGLHNKVTSCHDNIVYCMSPNSWRSTGDCQPDIPYSKPQNFKDNVVQKCLKILGAKIKCGFMKNRSTKKRICDKKCETKVIKVLKVTSDLKHLMCANNAIYKIKDVIPPDASGDYKFAFVVESKGIEKDIKFFCNKKQESLQDRLRDSKIPCACICYRKKDKRAQNFSKGDKLSCPCLFCKKVVLPIKCSSDQKISCHMMEVCKIADPKKMCLCQQKNTNEKADLCVCYPKKKPCKCGNRTCAKEIEKMAERHKMKAELNIFKKKKCICGSASCAAKLKKDKFKAKRHERKRHQKMLTKYKKEDAKRQKKAKNINRAKNMNVVEETKDNSNSLLMLQSLLDIKDFATTSAKNLLRGGYRAIRDPKYTCLRVKNCVLHPKTAIGNWQKTGQDSNMKSTIKRIGMRIAALSFIRNIKRVCESEPHLNYLVHINNKRKRQRPVPLRLEPGGCRMYLETLRNKPCFWVYYLWPSFYPHCINALRMFKQFVDIILFMSAIVVWSPCLLVTELLRATLCCLICTG